MNKEDQYNSWSNPAWEKQWRDRLAGNLTGKSGNERAIVDNDKLSHIPGSLYSCVHA